MYLNLAAIFFLVLLLLNKNMRKIFLVEDDQSIREVLEVVLSSENYDVRSFSNVLAFTQRDKSINPDLYLFDVMLPDGSGIDLCNELRNNLQNKDVPVIIMSAHAKLIEISDACQPDDFISKPFDIDNLLLRIHDILEN